MVSLSRSRPFLFLATLSPALLYGFYAVMAILIVALLVGGPARAVAFGPVLPYLWWVAIAGLWGALVSPVAALVIPEVARLIVAVSRDRFHPDQRTRLV